VAVVAGPAALGDYTALQTMSIPTSENALLIRTDFSDQSAWDRLIETAREPGDIFMFDMEVVDDRTHSGMTVEQLMAALPEDYSHSFMVVADSIAISKPDHPLLVVDLEEEPGRRFRAVAAAISQIDSNLSISNMGFEEFAERVDAGGVFRGIEGM
jgi:hypothetical protein